LILIRIKPDKATRVADLQRKHSPGFRFCHGLRHRLRAFWTSQASTPLGCASHAKEFRGLLFVHYLSQRPKLDSTTTANLTLPGYPGSVGKPEECLIAMRAKVHGAWFPDRAFNLGVGGSKAILSRQYRKS
jgi:hypothetical protein